MRYLIDPIENTPFGVRCKGNTARDKLSHREVPADKEDGVLDEILSLFLGRIWMRLGVALWEKGLVDCIGL